jgi:hypothetical protein
VGEILGIAGSITTPIAFAALALLIVYLVTRQLLQMNVFSNVGQRQSAGIIIRIVNRLFLLALIVSVLVFVLSLTPKILDYLKGGTTKGPQAEQAAEAAQALLTSFYDLDARTLYQAMPLTVQQQFGLAGAEKALRRERFQLPGAPVSRTPPKVDILSGNAMVSFDAEFDQASVWREQLVFVSQADEWRLWHITVHPVTPPTMPTQYLQQRSPAEFLAVQDPTSLRGYWTPLPGWTATVVSIGEKSGDYTCDVMVGDSAQVRRLHLSKVLGACALKVGTAIIFIAEFVNFDESTREFRNVRYYPASV